MKNNLLFLVLAGIAQLSQAQEIGLSIGYGSFRMNDLKALNKQLLPQTGPDSKIANNFPGYLVWEANFNTKLSQGALIGGFINLASTGSRIAYSDYSGHLYIDQRLWGLSLGACGWMPLVEDPKSFFGIGGRIGSTYSRHSLQSEFVVSSNKSIDQENFASINLFIEPGFLYRHRIKEWPFDVNFSASYNLNLVKGQMTYSEDSNAHLINDNGDKVKVDWSGIRVLIGFSYRI